MTAIADYALLGDCHSAALVSRDGSIDWACFPRFDSPAVFCRLLDEQSGGNFSVRPAGPFASRRAYLEDTNVLVTTFETSRGVLEVTDCMPISPRDGGPGRVRSHHAILRRLRCLGGEVEAQVHVAPRFEYASFTPRFTVTSDRTAEIVGGADALWLSATHPLSSADDWIEARWKLAEGQQAWIEAAWTPSHELRPAYRAPDEAELAARLRRTINFWREWMKSCWYEGDHGDLVRRSALVLKALTYAPTGAVIAAPTTSLPEAIGGERNWDYRYTWIRDATLTLAALYTLGFRAEADAFKLWLERTGAGRPHDLQIMYGIGGRRSLPEVELHHLAGHRGSAPVRIGNGAVKQMQLDCYGQILEAAYLYGKLGGSITESNWRFLRGLTDIVAARWRDPDHGIWEIRDAPRHFVHSKLHCWMALERALEIARATGLPAPTERWRAERDAVRAYLLDAASETGWFPQAVGFDDADASVLLAPALGFLPPAHGLVQATIDRVLSDLSLDGLVHRYLSDDGLEGGEGAFLLCSFWLVDALAHGGRIDEAERIFERLTSLANDVGLFAEEADAETGEALGNFPQAFTHMSLVTTSAHLSLARRGELPTGRSYDFAEVLLQRLRQRHPDLAFV